ncbi:MAG: MFS transporter [Gammaproteobacteria bacterium]|nr:MFS transporter [Gammaproteobacteria bacterium]
MGIKAKTKARMLVYGWVVCILAAFFYCYEYLLRIEPSVMVRELMHNFSITATGVGVLSAMYYYAYTPLQAIVGITTDYYGPRRVLTIAILSCTLGSLIFGLPHHVFYLAAIGRLLIGVGSAFAFVGVLKLAAMWLPHRHFALFVGITTALGMLGAMFGDVELSWLVGHYPWRYILMYSALAGAILAPLFFLVVKDKPEQRMHGHPDYKFRHLVKEFFVILKMRNIIIAGVIGCCMYLSLSAFGEIWGVLFLRKVSHLDKVKAASLNAMVFFGWLVGGPLHGFISDKIKSRRLPLIIGSFLGCIAFSVILWKPELPPTVLGVLLFSFGFFSSVQVLCFAIARDMTNINLAAMAIGIINLLVMISGVIFQPLIGHLLDVYWQGQMQAGVRVYSVASYRHALIVIPVMMLLATVLAVILPKVYNIRTELNSGTYHG